MLAPRHNFSPKPLGPSGFPFLQDDQVHRFQGDLNLEAMLRAERWITDNGFTVGPAQKGEPRGILRSSGVIIAKWTLLDIAERRKLDGVMVSPDMRRGPVVIRLRVHVKHGD